MTVSKRKPVVAIVDDDPRLLESLQELLASAGYVSICFPSAGSLLMNGLSDVDLLITDVGMPGMDGFELREQVMKSRPELPVFLITGRHEIAEQARARGINGLFPKPFDGQVLLSAIGDTLSNGDREGDHEC